MAYAYDRIPLDTTHRDGTTIDSVFPAPEMMRRFRSGLPATAQLTGGAASVEALVTAFVNALATRDRQRLGELTLSRAEFAYLYYPNSPDARGSNGLPPTLRWSQITLATEKGIGRALERIGGVARTFEGIDCPAPALNTGEMSLRAGCSVRLRNPDGSILAGRFFGPIVEYAGRYKFVGYANDM